ncbi:12537_t:CDS:2, partial [Acaulospora morrowiae]
WNLVNDYIKKEGSIIVATISCKDEIDNQEIVSLAKMVDPSGLRTLGVLTKPDMIEQNTHEPWLKIMKGEAHKLSLGYYVIKNPNKKRLMENITFEEAREEEIAFFENETPWRDNYEINERIGVKKLQSKLSDLLIKAIMNDLPIINKEIQEKLSKVREELENIPEPLGENSKMELYSMIKKFSEKIKDEVACSSESTEFFSYIVNEFKEFKRKLCSTRTIFHACKKNSKETVKFDMMEELVNDQEQATHITEAQVTDQINNARGKLLPGIIPHSVVTKLIRNDQNKWKSASQRCLDQVHGITTDLLKRTVDENFSRFPVLHVETMIHAKKLLDNCKKETTKYIEFMYEQERDNYPFTLDESTMLIRKAKCLLKLNETVEHEGKEPKDSLEVMASVMAYLKVSLSRYADNVSMVINRTLVEKFANIIEENLVEIFISNGDNCDVSELLLEDKTIHRRREELRIEENNMKEMIDSLVRFGIK